MLTGDAEVAMGNSGNGLIRCCEIYGFATGVAIVHKDRGRDGCHGKDAEWLKRVRESAGAAGRRSGV